MTWTTTPPTEPGLYFIRNYVAFANIAVKARGKEPMPVLVFSGAGEHLYVAWHGGADTPFWERIGSTMTENGKGGMFDFGEPPAAEDMVEWQGPIRPEE